MNEHHFHTMGTEVVVGATAAVPTHAVEELFRERERTFSRFLPDSELNRVNASAGRVVGVSDVFADTLALALRLAEQTDGLVDPTLGAALEAAGYARAALHPPDSAARTRQRPRGTRGCGKTVLDAVGEW